MGLVSEFKAFVMRGNVVDLAVGVIMGAAFGKVVSSLVGDVLMPPIGAALGDVNFSDLTINLTRDGKATIKYGAFIQSVIDLLVIGVCVFLMVKAMNRLKKAEAAAPSEPSAEVKLLTEIRDLLKALPGA